jgi:hypothetical protein
MTNTASKLPMIQDSKIAWFIRVVPEILRPMHGIFSDANSGRDTAIIASLIILGESIDNILHSPDLSSLKKRSLAIQSLQNAGYFNRARLLELIYSEMKKRPIIHRQWWKQVIQQNISFFDSKSNNESKELETINLNSLDVSIFHHIAKEFNNGLLTFDFIKEVIAKGTELDLYNSFSYMNHPYRLRPGTLSQAVSKLRLVLPRKYPNKFGYWTSIKKMSYQEWLKGLNFFLESNQLATIDYHEDDESFINEDYCEEILSLGAVEGLKETATTSKLASYELAGLECLIREWITTLDTGKKSYLISVLAKDPETFIRLLSNAL